MGQFGLDAGHGFPEEIDVLVSTVGVIGGLPITGMDTG
ncbi:hypothetical protein IWX65_000779 [Arthrobacter sp. CAN_A214]